MIYKEKVKVARLWEQETRTSRAGTEYPYRQVLFEKQENGYTDSLYFEVIGQVTDDLFKAKVGDEAEIEFRPDCHEYNGRWYSRLKLVSVSLPKPKEQPKPQPVQQTKEEGYDDLPF